MASTAAFSALAVPAHDDTMEMSSPANRPLDDDIDIDFGDYGGGTDDEQMVEDDTTRPATATDDMMEDDMLPAEQAVAEEEVMQDQDFDVLDVSQEVEDDELIDYGDEDFQDDIHEDIENVTGGPSAVMGTVIGGQDQVDVQPSQTAAAANSDTAVDQGINTLADAQNSSSPREVLPPSSVVGDHGPLVGASDEISHLQNVEEPSSLSTHVPEPIQETQQEQVVEVSYNAAETVEDTTPSTPTDTGLHPMMIRYGDLYMPLFRSRRQPDGLLKDDNLASISLGELLKNCRQRLALKVGEDLSEDQELHLGFDRLGLTLVEDSRVAFESSLNDILEVYLQLQRNDGIEDIPPLSLTLTLQLKFASSLSILKQAASNGQGMSAFAFLNPVQDDGYYPEQYEYDEATQVPNDDDAGEYIEGEEAERIAGDEGQGHEDTADTYFPNDGPEDANAEYEEGYDHDEQRYHEERQATDDVSDEPPAGIEHILQGQQQSTHATYNAPDDPAETIAPDDSGANSAALLDPTQHLDDQAESKANSTTVEGDQEASNSVPASTAIEDPSDALKEVVSDVGQQTADSATTGKVEQLLSDGAAAEHDFSIPTDEHTFELHNGENADAEDLQDFGDHAYEEDDQFQDPGDEGFEPGEDYHENEEGLFDQADTHEEQQEEYHPDYEPGADDEQFHTAQDFLDSEHYEQGIEDDVHDGIGEEALDDTVETVLHHAVDEVEQDENVDNFEDDFDFEEAFEEVEQSEAQHSITGALNGKRSFDESFHEQIEEVDQQDPEREPKKARAL